MLIVDVMHLTISVFTLACMLALELHARRFKVPAINVEMNPYYTSEKDCTTTLPLPVGHATCSHDWEEVARVHLTNDVEDKFVLVMKCPLCGTLDKTIEHVKQCEHQWATTTTELPSPYEQAESKMETNAFKKKGAPRLQPWVFEKKLVQTAVCTLCGKREETVVGNGQLLLENKEE